MSSIPAWMKAEEELEQHRFDSACHLFQQAAMLSEPDLHLLANLSIAQQEGQAEFYRALRDRYPNSQACWMGLIRSLKEAGHFDLAVQTATEAISHFQASEGAMFFFRLARLDASSSCQKHDFFCDDVLWLWSVAFNNKRFHVFKKSILQSIARCFHASFIDTLSKLLMSDQLEHSLAEVVTLKLNMLKMISAIITSSHME